MEFPRDAPRLPSRPPPATAAVTNFVEDLYNQGITGGCSASPLLYCYCPHEPQHAQMAVFVVKTLGLQLYGP